MHTLPSTEWTDHQWGYHNWTINRFSSVKIIIKHHIETNWLSLVWPKFQHKLFPRFPLFGLKRVEKRFPRRGKLISQGRKHFPFVRKGIHIFRPFLTFFFLSSHPTPLSISIFLFSVIFLAMNQTKENSAVFSLEKCFPWKLIFHWTCFQSHQTEPWSITCTEPRFVRSCCTSFNSIGKYSVPIFLYAFFRVTIPIIPLFHSSPPKEKELTIIFSLTLFLEMSRFLTVIKEIQQESPFIASKYQHLVLAFILQLRREF